MQIGFIGLGNMGAPMCRNLLRAGHAVAVLDRDPARMEALAADGATTAASPAALAAQCAVVFSSLPGPTQVEAVVLGPDGVAAAARPDLLLVDLTTSTPALALRLAEALAARGAAFVDAPVSGGTRRAAAGTLAVMAGGSHDAFARAAPLLSTFAREVHHVGAAGQGCTVKLVNNLLAFCNLAAASEAFVLGAKAGVEPATLYNVIAASSGGSDIMRRKLPGVLRGDFTPEAELTTVYKDIQLACALGEDTGTPLLMGGVALNLFRQALARYADCDLSAVIRPLEDALGVTVRSGTTVGE